MRNWEKHEAPLILYLKNQHFQLVLKKDGIELPRDWVQAKATDNQSIYKIRGAGAGVGGLHAFRAQSLRFWPQRTPTRSDSVAPKFRLWGKTPPQGARSGSGIDTVLNSPCARKTSAPSDVREKAILGKIGENKRLGSKFGTLFPVSVQEQLTRRWWTCQLCGFQVCVKRNQGKYSEAHGGARRHHLIKAHGVSNYSPPSPQ